MTSAARAAAENATEDLSDSGKPPAPPSLPGFAVQVDGLQCNSATLVFALIVGGAQLPTLTASCCSRLKQFCLRHGAVLLGVLSTCFLVILDCMQLQGARAGGFVLSINSS